MTPMNFFAGEVSRSMLLTRLLPCSFASFVAALIAGAWCLPAGYDWRVQVISFLASPRHNPRGCWLPSLGIVAAMLLVLPFAGYVGRRLRVAAPRLAPCAGLGFAFGFVLISLSVPAQLLQLVIGLPWLHELLARAGAGAFVAGMLCCCASALKDSLRSFAGQRTLPRALAFYWMSLTLLPLAGLTGLGTLLLSHLAGQAWAEDFRQSFRHTVFWQLAFWEWVGVAVAVAFLVGSVLLLPASDREVESELKRRHTGWDGVDSPWARATESIMKPELKQELTRRR